MERYLFSKQIMIRVAKYYSAAMTVKAAEATYSYTEFELTDKSKVAAGTFTGHLYTMFDCYYDETSKGFASAAFQDRDATTGRPISGSFHLNLFAIKPSPKNALAHYGTFVHEFYHILTFNNELFQHWVDGSNNKIGKANIVETVNSRDRYKLSGSQAIEFAKTHLNDNALSYIILENGGGAGSAGSHWEYDFWPNDFMSPIDTLPSLLSPLSLYMSKDAGWYGVNDQYADPLIYAKGAGADFQNTGTCPGDRNPIPIGFCATADKDKGMCSPDGMYKGKCGADETYNNNGGCPFIMGFLYCTVPSSDYETSVNYDVETIGAGSRCATVKSSSSYTPACTTTTCSGGTLTYKFSNGGTCSCSAGDANNDKSCGGYTVKCPSATSITLTCESLDTSKHRCPNDCSGKGFCLGLTAGSKKCWCKYGWTGDDCNTENTDEKALTSVGTTSTANKSNQRSSFIAGCSALLGLFVMILSSFL